MAIFGQYQGGDSFQVGPNMQNVLASQKALGDTMYEGVEKIIQTKQEMDVLRSTTKSVLSQYSADESGKPSPAAPKYIHDLYKAVEKEGGIEGLSKTSLLSVLKGYETGLQVDGQKMQIQQAQQQATLRGFEIDKAQREADEYKKIALAHKLALEAAGTPSGKKEIATAPTLAYDMPADMGEEIYKYQTGQRSTDPRMAPAKVAPTPAPAKVAPSQKPAVKQTETTKLTASASPERDALEAKLDMVGKAKLSEELLSKLEDELKVLQFQLARVRGPNKEYAAGEGQVFEGPKTLDEIRADKAKEPELVKRIDLTTKRIAEAKKLSEVASQTTSTPKPAGATPVSAPVTLEGGMVPMDANDKIASEFIKNNPPSKWKSKLEQLRDDVSGMETMFGVGRNSDLMAPWYDPDGKPVSRPELKDFANKVKELKSLEYVEAAYNTFMSRKSVVNPYSAPIGPAKQPPQDEINPAFLPSAVPESIAPKSTSKPISKAQPKAQPQAQPIQREVNSNPALKSDDEKIAEEYGMITSRLQALGGVPLNWSEDTYRQMRGYAPKIQILQRGGMALVGIGDKWQVVKTGAENQMSPSELATTEKHMVWKDSIRTDRLSNAKWTFRGDIRTTEADTAGKVKKAVTDSTRALEALDKLIELGETGFWDSITPTDKAGVISGVTNAVQAAGRTEIAGSGAFSEQDAKKLESVVPDLSSVTGAVFREKSLTMLKTYRDRMAQQVNDIGRTWGFEVKETRNAGLTEPQIAAMRGAYTDLVKQGYNHEDAKRLALESLNQ